MHASPRLLWPKLKMAVETLAGSNKNSTVCGSSGMCKIRLSELLDFIPGGKGTEHHDTGRVEYYVDFRREGYDSPP
jgi:hypothetical protein